MNLIQAPNGWKCPDDPGEPGTDKPRWSVNDTEARILAELLRNRDVLEIGTGLGISTRAIARWANKVYTVDPDPWVKKTVAPTLPENVVFLESIAGAPAAVDAAFIDGQHVYEQIVRDIADCKRIVCHGGIILLHDATMQAVMKAITENLKGAVLLLTWAGLAMAWNDEAKTN